MPIRNFGLASSRAESRHLLEQACASVGLNPRDTLGRYPHQLSGGQRQRLMVARALLLQPRVLVADEPVSMVDASLRATILGNIAELNQKHGIAVVYITHDLTTAYHIADLILVLYRGRVVEAGSAQTVIETPLHPYTQLLIDSIPSPDPAQRWGSRPLASAAAAGAGQLGCPFRDRCPAAMPACASAPDLREAAPLHAVSCYLYPEPRPLLGAQQAALLHQAARSPMPA